jgi:hypothetical protein
MTFGMTIVQVLAVEGSPMEVDRCVSSSVDRSLKVRPPNNPRRLLQCQEVSYIGPSFV